MNKLDRKGKDNVIWLSIVCGVLGGVIGALIPMYLVSRSFGKALDDKARRSDLSLWMAYQDRERNVALESLKPLDVSKIPSDVNLKDAVGVRLNAS